MQPDHQNSLYPSILAYLTIGMASGNTDPIFPLTWSGVTRALREERGYQGQISIVDTLDCMATIMDKFQAAYSNHPGVFAYEVAEPAGNWLATFIVSNSRRPKQEEIEAYLLPRCLDFFSKGAADSFSCHWCTGTVSMDGLIGEDNNGCPHCGRPCVPVKAKDLRIHSAVMDKRGDRWLTVAKGTAQASVQVLCLTPRTSLPMFGTSYLHPEQEVFPYRGAHYEALYAGTPSTPTEGDAP